jgi:hypothetical protein
VASAPDAFIVHVPSQVITGVPASVPRALLPEFIADLIRPRSPRIGKIRNLRVLQASARCAGRMSLIDPELSFDPG